MKRSTFFLLFSISILSLFLGLSLESAPAANSPILDHELIVVRAYFDTRQQVADLASWKEPWLVNYAEGYLIIELTPAEYEQLETAGFRLEIDPVATAEINTPRQPLPGQGGGIPGYPCYRTVEETFDTAEDIVANYPQLATWIDIGDSWEKTQDPNDGYDLLVLRLTNSAVPGPKPKFFTMSAVHAREYTTAELNTRYAEYLIQNYGTDADVTWLLDYNEVHLLLQANPDGRKYAEAGQFWRKNTNENYCGPTSSNRGADLNRNFEFQWGCCGGSSGNECSSTYRGASPASEPEVEAIQSYVRSIFPDQREDPINATVPLTATGVFMDIHSSGQLVLWPWGFTEDPAPNGTALQTLGRKFAYFNNYYPEQAIGLYPTDGTTDDFGYGDLGLAAYTFELGTSFFQSCSYFEGQIVPENLPALIYAAKTARTPYLTPTGPDALNVMVEEDSNAQRALLNLTATLNDTRYNNQNGSEPVQSIAAAEYYIDVPPWVTTTVPISMPMTAVDGTFNSSVEAAEATIDTTGLTPGQHILFVRGQDANGNWGAISAIFFQVPDDPPPPDDEWFIFIPAVHKADLQFE